MNVFYSKSTGGFYTREIHGASIPADAVEITQEEHAALFRGQAEGKVISSGADGFPVLLEPPKPSAEQVVKNIRAAIQGHLDASAAAAGYDDIRTAVTYAEEDAVPKFQAEGRAFRAWRSVVWEYAYAQLDKVLAGEREQPTIEAFLAELPPLQLN